MATTPIRITFFLKDAASIVGMVLSYGPLCQRSLPTFKKFDLSYHDNDCLDGRVGRAYAS